MPDLLKQALNQKFSSQENPLFGQQAAAVTNYSNTLDTGYQNVLPENNQGMIFSPGSQQAQIQGRRNSALGELAGINTRIGMGYGGIENIIGQATKMEQAMASQAQFKSEGARQKYLDLLNQIDKKVQQAADVRDFGEKTREFDLNYAQNERQIAKGSVADQTKAEYQNMIKDIKVNRMVLRDALTKYGASFTPDEIYNAYNTSSPRGPAKEGTDILSSLGITKGATGQDKYGKNDPDYQAVVKSLDQYAKDRQGTKPLERLNPTSPVGIKIETQKKVLTQILAKLVEKNRLSDSDRNFYLSQMPAAWMDDKQAQAKIDGIKSGISSQLGIQTETKSTGTKDNKDPLGLF